MNPDQQYVYVVLSRPASLVSYIIRLFTRSYYTHASLSITGNLNPMFSFARKYTYFPFWGTHKQERFSDRFYLHCRTLPGRIIAIPVSDEQYTMISNGVARFWNERSRYKYNYSGFILNAVHISHSLPNRYTCSQYVAQMLSDADICHFEKNHSLVRPEDLKDLPGEIIFDGDLKLYPGFPDGEKSE